MSVQYNTYVMIGALLPYDKLKGDDVYDRLEPYMDSAFDGIHHHNGLCCLYDGMNGKYVAIGRVIAKSDNYQGLDKPVSVQEPSENDAKWLRDEIMALVPGVEFTVEPFVLAHYR